MMEKMEEHMIQPVVAALVSSVIAIRAYRKQSLDLCGALAVFIVMTLHISVNCMPVLPSLSLGFGAMLLLFFFTSSKLTGYGEEKKGKLETEFKEGGQRNWIQVLSDSGIASILVLVAWKLAGSQDKRLDAKGLGYDISNWLHYWSLLLLQWGYVVIRTWDSD